MKLLAQSTAVNRHFSLKYRYRVGGCYGVLFSLILIMSGCGMIMDDPHPYPDMGGIEASDELEGQDNRSSMEPTQMNTTAEQE